MKIRVYICLMCLVIFAMLAHDAYAGVFSGKRFGKNSSVYVVDQAGKELYAWNAGKPLIPASTIKIATGLAAFKTLGKDYRFKTEFYTVGDALYVRGYGDPYLTSEELDVIADSLLQKVDLQDGFLEQVVADGSFYPALNIPGRKKTNQPYDAPLSAISANFNTINIKKTAGKIRSAEQQTPITPLARKLAKKLPNGVHRINLSNAYNAEVYFAELLAEKLKQRGVKVGYSRAGALPLEAKLVYTHQSSKTMEDAVAAMLYFSNNFIANQIFLRLRSSESNIGFSASANYVKSVLTPYLGSPAESDQAHIDEGSGLSRDNRLTAKQLVAMMQGFAPYKTLMKKYLGGKAYAKSGTLSGVRNLAGYVTKNQKTYYFVFLFNDPVEWNYRKKLLSELYRQL